jgi:RNA polymerase sigma-54 factor
MQQIQATNMAMGQNFSLKIAPQMRLMLHYLAMPVLELRKEIQKKLDENPALEEVTSPEVLLSTLERKPKEEPINFDDEKFSKDEDAADRKQQFLQNTIAQKETLQDHLLLQLGMQKNIDQSVIDVAEILVQSLNNDGFLELPPKEAVPNADEETLEKAVALVQMQDPQGTCTADYKESLAVQASLRDDSPEYAEEIIKEHLEDLEMEKYKKIAEALQISESDVLEIRDFVKTLNPFPGRAFAVVPDQSVIPSFTITARDGELDVYMNDLAIPVLQVAPEYKELDESPEANASDKNFVHGLVQDAQNFINLLDMRENTINKAAKEILKRQREFFLQGPKYLKPLTQREFAKSIKVSESTVSRIANSKYVQTDWGFYSFSYFFPSQGESVLEIIKEILETNKDKKLSDQQISDILKERGIKMARRTVSKYKSIIRRQT